MLVGGVKGCNVGSAVFTSTNQIGAAPCKAGTAKSYEQQVGRRAGMTAVAVWERMDEHEAVMEACCNFVRLMGFMFDPESAIIQELSEIH